MDPHSPYRRSYPNKRLDEAYRRFVRGEASLRQLEKTAKVSLRTIQRYSSKDQWVEELEERKAKAAVAASLMNQMAAMAPDVAAVASDGASDVIPGAKDIILGILKRQQQWWDRIERRASWLFDQIEKELEKPGVRAMSAAVQLMKVLDVAEKASANVRKAYGIPDVTRLEFEDKTPTAKKHVDVIRAKRAQRLAAAASAEAAQEHVN